MGKSIKISRIKLGNEFYNVLTGNREDLMMLSFALVNATDRDRCPVLILSSDKNNLLVTDERNLKNPVRTSKCKHCDMFKSCPVNKVLNAHTKNWDRIQGNISKSEKPRKTSSKYVKIVIE